jgi:tetratricopeptide (TPR) repeat protein
MPYAYANLGVIHYEERDWERTIEALKVAEPSLGGQEQIYYYLGLAHRRLGKIEEAAAYLEKQVEHDPLAWFAWLEVATTNIGLHRVAEAEEALDRVIDLRPTLVVAYFWKAWIQLAWFDDKEKAREILDEGCYNSGNSLPDFKGWLGRAAYRMLREYYEEAVWNETYESLGWRHAYYMLKGAAARLEGNAERSRAYYDSARAVLLLRVESFPEQPFWRGELGIANAGDGRVTEGIEDARTAMRLNESHANRGREMVVLAQVYLMAGEYDLAIEQLEQLVAEGGIPTVLRLDPLWDPLRDDPRFEALLESYE